MTASPDALLLQFFWAEVHCFIWGCPTALTLTELFAPPPVFSAVGVINVLSNVFSRNCDYAQGISKLFTVITGKGLERIGCACGGSCNLALGRADIKNHSDCICLHLHFQIFRLEGLSID